MSVRNFLSLFAKASVRKTRSLFFNTNYFTLTTEDGEVFEVSVRRLK